MEKGAKVGMIINKDILECMVEKREWRTKGSMVVDIERKDEKVTLVNLYV